MTSLEKKLEINKKIQGLTQKSIGILEKQLEISKLYEDDLSNPNYSEELSNLTVQKQKLDKERTELAEDLFS